MPKPWAAGQAGRVAWAGHRVSRGRVAWEEWQQGTRQVGGGGWAGAWGAGRARSRDEVVPPAGGAA